MKFTIRPVACLALITTLGFSSFALANPGGMSHGMHHGMAGEQGCMGDKSGHAHAHRHGHMMADPAAMMEKHLTETKATLKITADQEAAWQVFVGKAKENGAEMQAMRAKMQKQDAPSSAPERMQQRAEGMKSMAGRMEAMSANLQALYAVLSPEQKALADKHFAMMHGKRMDGKSMAGKK